MRRRCNTQPTCNLTAGAGVACLLVAVLGFAVPAGAQSAIAPDRRVTGYLAASYGVARAGEESYSWSWSAPVNDGGGQSRSRTTYNLPRGESFSIGGGAFLGAWGGGLVATQQSHQEPANCFEFFSTTAFPAGFEGSGPTDFDLERQERALHLHAMWAPRLGESLQAIVFAGPSYFYEVSQETLDFIDVELLGSGALRPVPFPPSRQEENAWGYHVGGDLTLYLADRFGVGLSALYSHATVELRDRYAEEMLTNVDVVTRDQDVGGIQLAVGLRVRL